MKTRNWRYACNRLILRRGRESVTENRGKVPSGTSRGYVVQEGGYRKWRHDGVEACYESGATSTAERQKAQTDKCAAYTRKLHRQAKPMAGALKQNANIKTRIIAWAKNKTMRNVNSENKSVKKRNRGGKNENIKQKRYSMLLKAIVNDGHGAQTTGGGGLTWVVHRELGSM